MKDSECAVYAQKFKCLDRLGETAYMKNIVWSDVKENKANEINGKHQARK